VLADGAVQIMNYAFPDVRSNWAECTAREHFVVC